ncbi:alkaline phosphatase family protein [Natronobiforma cellulositropha]
MFDFFTRDGYEKRLIDRRDVDAPYLPDVAEAEGKSVISINFPVTHPVPEYENGAVVPGYLATEDAEWHPEGLRAEYESEYGKYRIYPEYGTGEDVVEEFVDVARCRRDVATFLDSKFDWDLLAVQFQVTDSVFHDVNDPEKWYDVLEEVDGFVGDIVGLADDPNVFVVSDHGMGKYDWTFYVNTWLAEEGYCETTEGEPEYLQMKKEELKAEDGAESANSSALTSVLRTGVSLSSKVGLGPQRIHSILSTVGLAPHVTRLLPDNALLAAQNETVDWERSDAFQIFFNSCGIHLNKAGREPAGTLDDDAYEALREELIEKLEALEDPDGQCVFSAVERKEAVYDGAHFEDAPDIVLFPREYQYDVSGSILGPFRRNDHMNHRPQGIVVAAGPDIEPVELVDASIVDIAPTVAATMGLPVDTDRDGTVLSTTDREYEEDTWDELVDASWGETSYDESAVEERLADLGYME